MFQFHKLDLKIVNRSIGNENTETNLIIEKSGTTATYWNSQFYILSNPAFQNPSISEKSVSYLTPYCKMAENKVLDSPKIHEVLPTEVFVNILKKLEYKSITNAKRTCKEWKKIIEDFKLVEAASSKSQS